MDWFERAERRYMADLVTFLLDTGCRLSEALQLTWRDVPLIEDGEAIRVWKVQTSEAGKGTKNSTSRSTYQTIRVAALLSRRKAACPVGEVRVFWDIPAGRQGVHHCEKQWEKMRAGIGAAGERDFCLHSCRHTWASWLTQAGIHPMVLKTLGGWGNLKLVERYSHLAPNAGRDIYSKLNT